MNRVYPLLLLGPSFVAMAWLVSKAQYFWNHRPDLQFGWVVVLLCAYLFWEAWEKRPPVVWRTRWWAVAVAVGGAALLLLVQVYQAAFGTNSATTVGLALGVLLVVAANVGFVFGGKGIRRFAMPYGFILIAMPLPSIIYGPVVNGLQAKVALANTEILNLIGIPAQQLGSLIHLPAGTVGIDEACSGIRSLQSTVMATLFIGYLSLRRFSLQVALLVSGICLAVFGNVIRSLYLCLTANARGIDAISEVHDAAGWSILLFTAAGVIALSWLFGKLEKAMPGEPGGRSEDLAVGNEGAVSGRSEGQRAKE